MRPKVGVLLHPLCFFFSYSVEIYVYFVLGHSCKGTRKTIKEFIWGTLLGSFSIDGRVKEEMKLMVIETVDLLIMNIPMQSKKFLGTDFVYFN